MRIKSGSLFDIKDFETLSLLQGEVVSYEKQVPAFFKGNIPHVALILLEGSFTAVKGKNKLKLVKGTVVGLSEIICNRPMDFDLIVGESSKVFVLDRSCIREFLKSKAGELDIGDTEALDLLTDSLELITA